MGEPKLQQLIVTIDDRDAPGIEAIARDLEAAGLQVTSVLPTVGIVSGSAPSGSLEALNRVKGVRAIELDEEMHALDAPPRD